MGKKKKSTDIWDLTPEQQSKQQEDIYEVENGGDVSLLTFTNVSAINDNGFSRGLEAIIKKDLFGTTTKEIKEEVPENIFLRDYHVPEYMQACNIDFIVCKELHRLIIDDCIAPTSYSFDVGLNQYLIGTFDSDDASNMVNTFMKYIISLKHPYAIFTTDEFSSDKYKFNTVTDYNKDRFKFYQYKNYILCYIIDAIHNEKLIFDFIDKMEYDTDDIIKTMISISYAVGTLNQAFFVDEDAYFNEYIKYIGENRKYNFHSLFMHEAKETRENGVLAYSLTDVIELQKYVRSQIMRLTGEDVSDDEDYEDEFEEPDVNNEEDEEEQKMPNITEEVKNYVEECTDDLVYVDEDDYVYEEEALNEEEDDLYDLTIENAETVETSTENPVVIKGDDEEEFIIPVVRKK